MTEVKREDADESPKAAPPSEKYFSMVGDLARIDNAPEEDPSKEGHLYFSHQPGAKPRPDIEEARGRAETIATALRQLFREQQPDRFRQLFNQLVLAAQLLAGDHPNVRSCNLALDTLEKDVLASEAANHKQRTMKRLTAAVAPVAIPVFGMGAACGLWLDQYNPDWDLVSNALLMVGASLIGLWLSVAGRELPVSLQSLASPAPDGLSVGFRVLYVALITLSASVLFLTKTVVIQVGEVTSEKALEDWPIALVLGLALGFSEKLVKTKVRPILEGTSGLHS